MSDAFTTTFTAADIGKVADRFGADLTMLAQSSGAMSAERAIAVISDVREMAKARYISRVSVLLTDAGGAEVRARRYEVSTDAALWTSERPGGNIWPATPNGQVAVIVSYADAWETLSGDQRKAFQDGLLEPWGPSHIDIDFPGLSGQFGRRYASNGYGMERTDYQ